MTRKTDLMNTVYTNRSLQRPRDTWFQQKGYTVEINKSNEPFQMRPDDPLTELIILDSVMATDGDLHRYEEVRSRVKEMIRDAK